jgi:hypothetical protein
LSVPQSTNVTDLEGRWLATFTNGARTVSLLGPARTFAEPTAPQPVISTTWVRLLAAPFDGQVDETWLARALVDASPDVFATAMQYLPGSPPIQDQSGRRIAGASADGPRNPDGTRQEGGDFYDYLGAEWKFPDRSRQPDPSFLGCMDCSGYMRMIWGFRGGISLGYLPNQPGWLPRHSWEIAAVPLGVQLIPDSGTRVTDFARLRPGDLVFVDAIADAPVLSLNHVGMYLGLDTAGHHRFLSSRQTINGPTFGDKGGASLLDGDGLYARSFRTARRL